MKKSKALCEEYCTGCGLCHSLYEIPLHMNDDGFLMPQIADDDDITMHKLEKLCPVFGHQCADMDSSHLWGRRAGVYAAYSNDKSVRHHASSGGILTQLCCYLLENSMIDGIIHIGKDPSDPIGSKVYCSRTAEEVKDRCGSRYMSSSPLYDIKALLKAGEKYALVGKPCDIAAVRNWMRQEPEIERKIVYLFSFFCAGAPSRNVNKKLLEKMKCDYEQCTDLNYRGNGWPGYATATDINGHKYTMKYQDAWGKTLGRDIRKMCRFCLDGVGEMADISCGDLWYMNENKLPTFDEREGRNIVFCRTEKGKALFERIIQSGEVCIEDYPDCEADLQFVQKHQYFKKATMQASISAMRLLRKPTPLYDKKLMKKFSANADAKNRYDKFKGTVKRILQRTI